MKPALITGQDGSYLAELLIEKGYELHDLLRRVSLFNTQRIDHLIRNDQVVFYYEDQLDFFFRDSGDLGVRTVFDWILPSQIMRDILT